MEKEKKGSNETGDRNREEGTQSLEERFFKGNGTETEELAGPVVENKGLLVRSPFLMVIVTGLCVWLMLDFRQDLMYFFSPSQVLDLGDAADIGRSSLGSACSIEQGCAENMVCKAGRCSLPVNRYVKVTGIPLITRVSKSTVWGETRNYFPLMGSRNRMFVSIAKKEEHKKGVVPHGPYTGRLMDMKAPEYRALREYYLDKFGTKFPDECYILIDGSKPGDKYLFLLLYIFLSLLVLFNLYSLYRFFAWKKEAAKVGAR